MVLSWPLLVSDKLKGINSMWYEWVFLIYIIITLCAALMVIFIAKKPVKSGVFYWPVWVPMCFYEALKEVYCDGKKYKEKD